MEAKFLAGIFSFLSIFLAICAAEPTVNDVEDSTEFEFETALYYGDSTVNLGERFTITCIIPITDPIDWLKDDEPIKLHNLRHGHDEHSYVLTESAIEGEKHKIEAHISVRHALKVHEGKYQCNNFHTSYHMLHVRSPDTDKLETLSPFILQQHHMGGSRNRNEEYQRHFPTESGYVTIHDLTPSQSNEDDLFTRTWEPTEPETPPQILALPTKKPVTTTTSGHHHSRHHAHDQHDAHLPHLQQMEHDLKHKLFYINTTTNFDGSAVAADTRYRNITAVKGVGIVNMDLNPPPTPPHYTTESWRPTSIYYAVTPPSFPPPRTTPAPKATVPPPPPPPPGLHPYYHNMQPPYYMPGYQHKTHEGYHLPPGSAGGMQQTHYQPLPPYYYPQYPPPSQQQHPPPPPHQYYNPMVTFPSHSPAMMPGQQQQPPPHLPITYYQHPFQQYAQLPANQQYMPMPVGGSIVATSAPMFAPATPAAGVQQQQPPQQPPQPLPGVVSMIPMAPPNISLINPLAKDEFLVPNYDNAEHQLKVFEIRRELLLTCQIRGEGSYELKWEKNGTDVSKVKELEGRYRIKPAENTFMIDKTDITDDGIYSCVANNQRKDFKVVSKVAVRVPSNSGVVEGEKLSIVCTVVGTDPRLSWSFGNLTINNSTDRYILRPDDNKIQNAILTIENVSLDDRGEYKCIGRNDATDYANAHEASDVSFVRVKGKFAALWPFLGICAEVLILCTIILIYEKRRNKNVVDDEDQETNTRRNY